MQKIKLAALPVLMMLGLLVTGVAFAHWSKTLKIYGIVNTGELDWEFENNSLTFKDVGNDWTCDSTCDPPRIENIRLLDKDVGSTTGEFKDTDNDGDLDKLEVKVHNAYPCYYNHLDVWLHNNGTIPLIVQKVIIDGNEFSALPVVVCLDLDNDGKNDIIIRWGDSFGVQLHPCDSVNLSFDFHILQNAPQNSELKFTIEIVAIQYNEY